MIIRRINFFAGPGASKSTLASGIFYYLKKIIVEGGYNYQVELIQEYVKTWAWDKKPIIGFDQTYIFAKQLHREEIPLRNGVDLILTDSPLLMQCMYAESKGVLAYKALYDIAYEFENCFNSINYFIERNDRPYVSKGRYETLEKAIEMDNIIKEKLDKNNIKYYNIDSNASAEILAKNILEYKGIM